MTLKNLNFRSSQRKSLMQVLSRHLTSDNVLIMFALVRAGKSYFGKGLFINYVTLLGGGGPLHYARA